MKIDRVLIIANSTKPESDAISRDMTEYFEKRNIKSRVIYSSLEDDNISIERDTDLIVTLGGDGTVLYASHFVAEEGIPILPVNLGSFGYITEVGKDEWREAFEDYIGGEENYSRRLMLKVDVERDGRRVFSSTALNEAVIASSGIAKIITLRLIIDKTYAGTFRADGLIVATPTGSTGYSLAAGGPILDAELSATLITPICPFTLSNRPLVTSDKKILIEVQPKQRTEIVLSIDGQSSFHLKEGDRVFIEKSRTRMILIQTKKRSFTEVIRDKLNWSGEMHA